MASRSALRPRSARRRGVPIAAALALIVALPATSLAADPWTRPPTSLVTSPDANVKFVPLVNSGDIAFGDTFEGIPDGIGAVPLKKGWPSWLPWLGNKADFVDLYVNHEQSHVPFGGFADLQDSSVSRVRIDTKTMSVVDMEVVLPPTAGFIRLCSSFMAGPREGFPFYTLLTNEESNDQLEVPAGAVYGSDPSLAPNRQGGYSVWLNTVTGKYDVIAGAGRHNHENQVVVPGGWWGQIVSISGDDTFTTPSTELRPNFSQLYMFSGRNFTAFTRDRGTLWAFRVTATQNGPVDSANAFNDANDYLELAQGQTWKGEFIKVPDDIARGTANLPANPDLPQEDLPQNALEDWSNANNVFQFVRVEDIDYDPDGPRTIYFADTGNSRLVESAATGRLWRPGSGGVTSAGRIFKMVFNKKDPRLVDEFSVVIEASSIGMRNPDNLDAGSKSLMVQEDVSNAKVWRWNYGTNLTDWTHVATAAQPTAETSGILDVSRWFGAGWWALDVQSHASVPPLAGEFQFLDPKTYTWNGPPGPATGTTYQKRREKGQLLLMYVPGS